MYHSSSKWFYYQISDSVAFHLSSHHPIQPDMLYLIKYLSVLWDATGFSRTWLTRSVVVLSQTPQWAATMFSGCQSTAATTRPEDRRNLSRRSVSVSYRGTRPVHRVISGSVLCKARASAFVWRLKRTAPLKKTTPPSESEALLCWICTGQINWLLFWILWVSGVVRHVACWPIKRIDLNNVSRNGGPFTSNSPSHVSRVRLLVGCRRVWVGVGRARRGVGCLGSGWYRMAEAWQSTHSLGTGSVVARKYTSFFYRSLGRIPACVFSSVCERSASFTFNQSCFISERVYTHTPFLWGVPINVDLLYYQCEI